MKPIQSVFETGKVLWTLNTFTKAYKPGIWGIFKDPNKHWLFKKGLDAVRTSIVPEELDHITRQANENMRQWQRQAKSETVPGMVEVIQGDNLEVARKLSRERGTKFSVGCANSAELWGGDFPYSTAEEEARTHRLTSAGYIYPGNYPIVDGIVFDEKSQDWVYSPEARLRLIGRTPLSEDEARVLSTMTKGKVGHGYKSFFNPDLVCFKGPQVRFSSELMDDGNIEAMKRGFVLDPSSYRRYKDNELFLIDDLGIAAPRLCDGSIRRYKGPQIPVDWTEGSEFLEFYKQEMRHRLMSYHVASLLGGQPNIISTAFGCDAYQNKPEVVARLMGEVIREFPPGTFNQLVFAIIDDRNYQIFHDELNGLSLGHQARTSSRYGYFSQPRVNETDESTSVKAVDEEVRLEQSKHDVQDSSTPTPDKNDNQSHPGGPPSCTLL